MRCSVAPASFEEYFDLLKMSRCSEMDPRSAATAGGPLSSTASSTRYAKKFEPSSRSLVKLQANSARTRRDLCGNTPSSRRNYGDSIASMTWGA